MARRLGALSWAALDLAADERDLEPLVEGSDLCAAEVRTHLRHGAVARLEDLLLRRVRVGMWDPPRARELVPALRPAVAFAMGWDALRWDQEVERLDQALLAWSPEGVR
jgi:glycerol-3-phosphate dehydrogenase